MTEYDPRIAAILDRLVPRLAAEPDGWEKLLRVAGVPRRRELRWPLRGADRRRRHRVVVLAAALVTTVVVAIPALAVSKGWWFLHSGAPKPKSEVAVVTSGRAAGIDWTMTAYVSGDKGVCVALTLDLGREKTGGMSCGSDVRGEPIRSSGEPLARHWVGYGVFSLRLYDFPDFVSGLVAEGVDRVDVVLSSGQIIGTDTLKGPDELQVPLDFFALPLPRGVSVKSVIARDSSGNVLEQRACRLCAGPASVSSAPTRP